MLALLLITLVIAVSIVVATRCASAAGRARYPEGFEERAADAAVAAISSDDISSHLREENVYANVYNAYSRAFPERSASLEDLERAINAYKEGKVTNSVADFIAFYERIMGVEAEGGADDAPRQAEGGADDAPREAEGGSARHPAPDYDLDADTDFIGKHVKAVYSLVAKKANVEVLRRSAEAIRGGAMSLLDLYSRLAKHGDGEEAFEMPPEPVPKANATFDMQGNVAERPEIMHERFNLKESGRQKVEALYERLTTRMDGAADRPYVSTGPQLDPVTMDLLVDKYAEFGGDLARVENLITTMLIISEAESSERGDGDSAGDAMRIIAHSLDRGVPKAQALQSIGDWKSYETEMALRRPNASLIKPGEGMLSRPWREAAKQTLNTVSYNRNELQPINAVPDSIPVRPGESERLIGQADWMFA